MISYSTISIKLEARPRSLSVVYRVRFKPEVPQITMKNREDKEESLFRKVLTFLKLFAIGHRLLSLWIGPSINGRYGC